MPISAVIAEPALRRDHDGGEHRSHFPDQRQGDQGAESPLRSELNQGMIRLETQDHAGEQADKHDDQRGPCTDIVDLLDYLGQLFGPRNLQQRQKEENGRGAQVVRPADRRAAESGEGSRQ